MCVWYFFACKKKIDWLITPIIYIRLIDTIVLNSVGHWLFMFVSFSWILVILCVFLSKTFGLINKFWFLFIWLDKLYIKLIILLSPRSSCHPIQFSLHFFCCFGLCPIHLKLIRKRHFRYKIFFDFHILNMKGGGGFHK